MSFYDEFNNAALHILKYDNPSLDRDTCDAFIANCIASGTQPLAPHVFDRVTGMIELKVSYMENENVVALNAILRRIYESCERNDMHVSLIREVVKDYSNGHSYVFDSVVIAYIVTDIMRRVYGDTVRISDGTLTLDGRVYQLVPVVDVEAEPEPSFLDKIRSGFRAMLDYQHTHIFEGETGLDENRVKGEILACLNSFECPLDDGTYNAMMVTVKGDPDRLSPIMHYMADLLRSDSDYEVYSLLEPLIEGVQGVNFTSLLDTTLSQDLLVLAWLITRVIKGR